MSEKRRVTFSTGGASHSKHEGKATSAPLGSFEVRHLERRWDKSDQLGERVVELGGHPRLLVLVGAADLFIAQR